jgi:dTDP-4-dehydrorhamnose reductase
MESDRIKASLVNSAFPRDLARVAEQKNARVLQIATDCVFSGNRGHYLETDLHDAIDVYGKTKSLGEAESESVMHVRVSIIGRELNRSTHLLEWVLSQANNAVIPGYVDHFWNGVTTKHFAKMAHGIITSDTFKPGVSHLVPANELSKAELVREIASTFGRLDLKIDDTESGHPTNRTLGTSDPVFNQVLWEVAGYREIPTIHQLVSELRN